MPIFVPFIDSAAPGLIIVLLLVPLIATIGAAPEDELLGAVAAPLLALSTAWWRNAPRNP